MSILAPLIETLINQHWIIRFLSSRDCLKGKEVKIALISALIFGAGHFYSLAYILFGFVLGLLFAYAYIVYQDKKFSAYWIVFWIHCIRNFISFCIFYFPF